MTVTLRVVQGGVRAMDREPDGHGSFGMHERVLQRSYRHHEETRLRVATFPILLNVLAP